MTLAAIQSIICSIPLGRKSGFLIRGLKRHTKYASIDSEILSPVLSFLMTSAIKSVQLILYVCNLENNQNLIFEETLNKT